MLESLKNIIFKKNLKKKKQMGILKNLAGFNSIFSHNPGLKLLICFNKFQVCILPDP
jgi:hypothetical protein